MFKTTFNINHARIQRMLHEFSPIFIKNIIDNNIVKIIESDMPSEQKSKICIELLELGNKLLFGEKIKKYEQMIFGINRFSNLEKYISEVVNKEEQR